jgi:hypothetical protein
MLVTGIGVGAKNDEYWPEWELRSEDGKSNPLLPEDLDFYLSQERYCIGYRPPGSGSLHPCPNEVTGTVQCEDCERWTGMLPCLRCPGDRCRNPVRAESCIQPENHILYLAAYAPGMYKVGVARAGRRWQRIWEQGARAGVILATDDGLLIRRWEQHLKAGGIPDRWSRSDHERALSWEGDESQLLADLRRIAQGLQARYPHIPWLAIPEERPFHLPHIRYAKSWRLSGGEHVQGKVLGVYGRAVLLQRDDGKVLLQLSDLIGYKVHNSGDSTAYQLLLPFEDTLA